MYDKYDFVHTYVKSLKPGKLKLITDDRWKTLQINYSYETHIYKTWTKSIMISLPLDSDILIFNIHLNYIMHTWHESVCYEIFGRENSHI